MDMSRSAPVARGAERLIISCHQYRFTRNEEAMQRQKHLCTECRWAAKGPCPRHPGKSLLMGSKWRPGKKGRKTRLWDNRVHGSIQPDQPMQYPRMGARPSRYRYGVTVFNVPASPPPGLLVLGATDFSRSGDDGTGSWNRSSDPVRRAIAEKNQKPSLEHQLKLPSKEPGWPFPYWWE
jgi:hypothetical protein